MESMKDTLASMMEMFQKRMSEFEADLQKDSNASSTTTLAADFSSFKTFILQALGSLQKQVEHLAHNVDRLEMRGRRKILLLHGVSEAEKEQTDQVAAKVVQEHLKLEFAVSDIRRCLRMGRSSAADKPRPILIKFHSIEVRDTIWFTKTKLKGSGITVSEFLTKTRHEIFMAAREKFGVNKCWTREGFVFILGTDGKRHRVASLSDVHKMQQQVTVESTASKIASAEKVVTSRPKRAVKK